MKKVTLSFIASFNPNLDCEKKFMDVQAFFNELYLNSLSNSIEHTLKIDAKLADKEQSEAYGVNTLLSFVGKITEDALASVSYTPTGHDDEYQISFSFDFNDDFDPVAIKHPSIEEFVDLRMIGIILEGNKMMTRSLEGIMPRAYALNRHLESMIESFKTNRSIVIEAI